MKMIGKKGKPFCGDCCSEYPKGSGKGHKRIIKKINKRKEEKEWRQEWNAKM